MDIGVMKKRKNVTNVLAQREDFLIIALTGRMGSGCSTVANILSSGFNELNMPWPVPGYSGMKEDRERDIRIVTRYANSHWLAFERIKVRTVITSFLLEGIDEFSSEAVKLLKPEYIDESKTAEELAEQIKDSIKNDFIKKLSDQEVKEVQWENDCNNLAKRIPGIDDETITELKNLYDSLKGDWNKDNEVLRNSETFYALYQGFYDEERTNDRRIYMEIVDSMLNTLTLHAAAQWCKKFEGNCWERLKIIDDSLFEETESEILQYERFVYVKVLIDSLGDVIHDYLKSYCREDSFSALFQKYGNKIRNDGYVFHNNPKNNKDDIFHLPRKTNRFIKVMRHPFHMQKSRPVRIVIDSLKNVFEAMYLRYRYTAFYLVAVSAEEGVRLQRLSDKDLNRKQISFLNWNEYPSIGTKLYERAQKNDSDLNDIERAFIDKVDNRDGGNESVLSDNIRQSAYKSGLYQFYLQDVEACIQNADIYISNSINSEDKTELKWSIIRNVSLIMYPGLIQPTEIERCMQIAYAAKANSGCLSRQVGAVITDSKFNILSIGWNDVPCGEVSCARRNLIDISKYQDKNAYSEYEWNDYDFRSRTSKYEFPSDKVFSYLHGLPLRYCFKDFHAEKRNPMRSRAMHAEEKAFAVINGEEAAGGYLFTTSSPCEMCSKNAKNHKIKNIYYIEFYPGISESQYSHSGSKDNQARHILYTGAVGRAYTQMYTPIMPYKDMLSLMGIDDFKRK